MRFQIVLASWALKAAFRSTHKPRPELTLRRPAQAAARPE